jgi:starch synthase
MKILYAASEARPFVASGGLADVAESLPKALNNRKDVECRVVMPLYKTILGEFQENLKFIARIKVPLSWRSQYCNIFEREYNGVIYYLIEKEYYFGRDKLYGEFDDAERFAFFSIAVLEMLRHIDFVPDIINCNDWHTALIPIYRHALYSNDALYSGIKTVFTIHNIASQGVYDFEIFQDVFGLPDDVRGLVEYADGINLLKGAIESAHAFSSVSPTYAKEIAGLHFDTSGYDFGKSISPFINERSWKITGILNGLDYSQYNPKTDENLYENYDIFDYATGKAKNKLELQKRFGLEQRADVPLISIITRIDSQQKGCQHVIEAIDNGLLDNNDVQFVLLGNASETDGEGKTMESKFSELEDRYKRKMVSYIGFVPELAQKIYAAADIFIMPSLYEPCGLSQIISLKYGTIPVVRETGGLSDTITDFQYENGNGFTYKNYSSYELKDTIERALRQYNDTDSWNALIVRAMNCDFSWEKQSADEYIQLYNKILSVDY